MIQEPSRIHNVPLKIAAHGTRPAFCSVLRDAAFAGLQRAHGTLPPS